MGSDEANPSLTHLAFVLSGSDLEGTPNSGTSDDAERLAALLRLAWEIGLEQVSFWFEGESVQIQKIKKALEDIDKKEEKVSFKALHEVGSAATLEGSLVVDTWGPNNGRKELTEVIRELAGAGTATGAAKEEKPRPSDLEDAISRHARFAEMPDPDLMVFFGGRKTLSNLGVWRGAYAEFAFLPKPWHSFTARDLRELLSAFDLRERRFGAISG